MTASDVKQDLNYVSSVLRRSEPPKTIPAIYFLWAAITLVGFALPDFSPHYAGVYWAVLGPAGGVASFLIGWRAGVASGELDWSVGRRYAWHWGLAGLCFFLVVLPIAGGTVDPLQIVPYFLLVVGLAYALAGVHLEPPLKWVGLLMLGGYVSLTLFRLPYAWTLTGILVALALSYSGWRARR